MLCASAPFSSIALVSPFHELMNRAGRALARNPADDILASIARFGQAPAAGPRYDD
jgi:hypothetical protein